jgi:hypothetical protein
MVGLPIKTGYNKQFCDMAAELLNSTVVHKSALVKTSTDVLRIPPHHKAAGR